MFDKYNRKRPLYIQFGNKILSFRYDFDKPERGTCKCEVFNSYDEQGESKNRVQLYHLLQINSCANIWVYYCTKPVEFVFPGD